MKCSNSVWLAGLLALPGLVIPASFPAVADSFYWGCAFRPTTLQAGSLTCQQTVSCQTKSLNCASASKSLFVADAFADHIAVPEMRRYVAGFANRGMVQLYWLRDFDGKSINMTPGAEIHFCERSVTNVRVWFDRNAPDVRFRFEGERLERIIIRGCDGRDVSFSVDNP